MTHTSTLNASLALALSLLALSGCRCGAGAGPDGGLPDGGAIDPRTCKLPLEGLEHAPGVPFCHFVTTHGRRLASCGTWADEWCTTFDCDTGQKRTTSKPPLPAGASPLGTAPLDAERFLQVFVDPSIASTVARWFGHDGPVKATQTAPFVAGAWAIDSERRLWLMEQAPAPTAGPRLLVFDGDGNPVPLAAEVEAVFSQPGSRATVLAARGGAYVSVFNAQTTPWTRNITLVSPTAVLDGPRPGLDPALDLPDGGLRRLVVARGDAFDDNYLFETTLSPDCAQKGLLVSRLDGGVVVETERLPAPYGSCPPRRGDIEYLPRAVKGSALFAYAHSRIAGQSFALPNLGLKASNDHLVRFDLATGKAVGGMSNTQGNVALADDGTFFECQKAGGAATSKLTQFDDATFEVIAPRVPPPDPATVNCDDQAHYAGISTDPQIAPQCPTACVYYAEKANPANQTPEAQQKLDTAIAYSCEVLRGWDPAYETACPFCP